MNLIIIMGGRLRGRTRVARISMSGVEEVQDGQLPHHRVTMRGYPDEVKWFDQHWAKANSQGISNI